MGDDSIGVPDTDIDCHSQEPLSREDIVEEIAKQVDDLCHIHDHITRIIANLNIDEDWFNGYDEPGKAKFELEPMVKTFLYKYARDFTQSELARRLQGAAYVYIRFDLHQPIDQQVISYNKRRRFDLEDRQVLQAAADRLQELCVEHDVVETNEPALEPEDVKHEDVSEDEIMSAVQRATDLGFGEFSADRASNAKYALDAYFERQGYLNMARAGATSKRRRFARLSERDEVPHGSSHNRTMKKIATPDSQLSFDAFTDGQQRSEWKRVRDEVLEPFHAGVEQILDEVTSDDRDATGFREPVHAAVDITTWPFYMSPFLSEAKAQKADKDPIRVEIDGEEKLIDPDHPEMVSGIKDTDERGYKFATITIIAEDTPIVLGVEPVRDERKWERESEKFDVEKTSRGEIVERLLEQAEQHVDINKVFLDRGFDSKEVRDVIDRVPSLYVLGKRKNADVDKENIQEVKDDGVYDSRVEWGSLEYEGRTHDISYIYTPTDEDEENQEYAIFTVNEHVEPGRAEALIGQYNQRMEIENQYKSIKEHFLPKTCSSDYRPRFLYFVVGVVMYNVWRLANFILRDVVAVDLGENPPISAGECIELVGLCLFDPGG